MASRGRSAVSAVLNARAAMREQKPLRSTSPRTQNRITAAQYRQLSEPPPRRGKGKDWEEILCRQLLLAGLPVPIREYRFNPSTRHRSDLAYPSSGLLIECEGATWSGGRHTRGKGYRDDCYKYNLAALLGYTVLRFTGDMIESGLALSQIEAALKLKTVAGDR